jgi:NADH:ubiquinone reductase (H+-translocating)
VTAEADGGRRRRVVVVGGGFGGLTVARELRRADVDVTLVDRTNHHLFQPLLYQVAAGGLSQGDCASAIRGHLRRHPNASVLMAEVTDLDVERRRVIPDRAEPLDYDSLVVACGAETSYFGHDEWAETSFGLKTLRDAVALRERVVSAFEEAERATDSTVRDELLTFVVVGGGPTGVEIAGQLGILARSTLKRQFSRIDTSRARVILVDAGDRVVPAFSEKLSAKTARGLAELGVTVREHAMATAIDSGGLTIKTGEGEERIASRTVIWAAGVHAAGLTEVLARATGASTDRGGRIEVGSDCTVPGHPEISAIGDMASHPGPDGKPLPGLATTAIQQAHHVARAIRQGKPGPDTPFKYLDKGALAVIGRGKAVCEIRGLKLSGRPAFAMYLGIHLTYLSGVSGRRLRVFNAWVASRFGTRESWVLEGELPGTEQAPADAEAQPLEPAPR